VLRLLIKEHIDTGLKYLCKTSRPNYYEYNGSGKYWKRYIKKHGKNIKTTLLFETENKEEFRKIALEYSHKFNVIKSDEWANLRNEDGDGGTTTKDTRWITNGKQEKIIYPNETIPDQWYLGRSPNCVFSNSQIQSILSKRVDRKKQGNSLKRCWDEGRFQRDHSKCGTRGENHHTKKYNKCPQKT
jgi:hypothetical protein